MRALILVASLLIAAACNRRSVQNESRGETAVSTASSEEADRQVTDKLETEARALAKTEGCSSSADCRAAPIGARGCGGPRTFIVYCAKSTDSAALYDRIKAADSAERVYNAKYNVVSTCEMRLPPAVEAAGGSCVAK
jgi:hypothetical protein